MESTKLGKYNVVYPNQQEYHSLKREIWGQDCYHFETENNTPLIIDIGSHIGISILYFKSLYPNSNIVGFEPNPNNFEILNENIISNGIEDIELINKAIWKEDGIKKLYIDSTDNNWNSNSSFLEGSWNGKEKTKDIIVETTKLDKYIENKHIDCLKIDVEGSELSILKSIRRYLNNTEYLFIEYHPNRNNKLNDITALLQGIFHLEYYEDGKLLKKIPNNRLLTIKGINKNYR